MILSLPSELLERVAADLDAEDAARAAAASTGMRTTFGPACSKKIDEKIVFWRDEFARLRAALGIAHREIYQLGQEYYDLRPDADYIGADHECQMVERIAIAVSKYSSLEWEFEHEDFREIPEDVDMEEFELPCSPYSMTTTANGHRVRIVLFPSTEGICPVYELYFDDRCMSEPSSSEMFAISEADEGLLCCDFNSEDES